MRIFPQFALGLGLMAMLLGSFGVATSVFACSCAERTPEEQFISADAVFVGTVKSISEEGTSRLVDFDVNELQKGSIASEVTITTAAGESACGFPFAVDRTYAVYAYKDGDELHTSICGGTELFTGSIERGDDNDGAAQNAVEDKEDEDNESDIALSIVIVIIAFGAGALAARFLRREKK